MFRQHFSKVLVKFYESRNDLTLTLLHIKSITFGLFFFLCVCMCLCVCFFVSGSVCLMLDFVNLEKYKTDIQVLFSLQFSFSVSDSKIKIEFRISN